MPSRGRRWDKLRNQVLSQEPRCRVCGDTEELEVDHIVPTSRGGGDERENLQVLCRKHNAEKGGMLPWEQALWQAEERRKAEQARARDGAWLERHKKGMEDQQAREAMFEKLDQEYREGLELTPYHPDL